MKKNAIVIFITVLTVFQANAQSTKVHGSVSGLNSNAQLVVSVVEGNKVLPLDTISLDANGNYSFETAPSKSALYLFSFMGVKQCVIHAMLIPGDNVTLDMTYDEGLNYMNITNAKGSKNMQVYKEFNQEVYNFTKAAKKIDDEYSQPSTTEQQKQELSKNFELMQDVHNMTVRKLLEKNTDVLMSAFLVTYFENDIETYFDLFEAIDKGLGKKYPDNQFVQYVSSKVKTSLGPGRTAPEIAMKDPDGKERKLSDLRGKIVLIDFWASWCRPCRMENPNVVKLYHKYHDKGFEIFSVSLDKTRNDWVSAIEQDGLVWSNHVSDLKGWTSSGGASYGITSVPSTVLVDKSGKIIARNLRGAELERKLKEIFGE